VADSAGVVACRCETVGVVILAPGDFQLALGSGQLFSLPEEELAVRLQIRLDGGGVGTCCERGA
jgi:hypothetical protein